MNLGLWRYIKEAFHAKYLGMFLSPSWVIIAITAFLGWTLSPGFFLIGAGIELSYLFLIATHPRFQNYIHAKIRTELSLKEKLEWQERIAKFIKQLGPEDTARFYDLKSRCDSVVEFYSSQIMLATQIIDQHSQSLNKLLWIFLQLLVAKMAVNKLMRGTPYSKVQQNFSSRIKELEEQIAKTGIADDLKKSLESKRDILKMRLQALTEANQKLDFIDAELDRIEQQVELIREQAVVSKDSQGIANRIDLVSSTLSQTGEWIKQQEGFLGSIESLVEPSPAILSVRPKQAEGS